MKGRVRSHVGWRRDGAAKSQRRSAEMRGGVRGLVEEWRDCEELEPKPEKSGWFVDTKLEAEKHRTEWCGHKQRPLHEMREAQADEVARDVWTLMFRLLSGARNFRCTRGAVGAEPDESV